MASPGNGDDALDLVREVANTISLEEMQTLGGAAPTGGHGFYAPGVVATKAVLRWLAERERNWHRTELDDMADDIERFERAEHWAYLKGGDRHGQ